MYPVNESLVGDEVILSYQTLTVDLYAPLLLLILLSSLVFSLLSCSCSRLSDQYRLATVYASPLFEISGCNIPDPTTILARYDFQLSQALTASLPQFCLQYGSYIVILHMLETLKGLSVDKATQDTVQEKIDSFAFSSLWFSGLGSALSLIVAQYTALKIQHEHDLTLGQRIIYFVSCIFNTIAMMTSSVIFITVIILPVSTYVGRYHIMILVISFAAILGLGTLISLTPPSSGSAKLVLASGQPCLVLLLLLARYSVLSPSTSSCPHPSSSSTLSASFTPQHHALLPSTMPLPSSLYTTTFSSSPAAFSSVLISMSMASTTISLLPPRTSLSMRILLVFPASSWLSSSSSSSTAPLTSGHLMVSTLCSTKTFQPSLILQKLVWMLMKMKMHLVIKQMLHS